jgi:hypothetical protein
MKIDSTILDVARVFPEVQPQEWVAPANSPSEGLGNNSEPGSRASPPTRFEGNPKRLRLGVFLFVLWNSINSISLLDISPATQERLPFASANSVFCNQYEGGLAKISLQPKRTLRPKLICCSLLLSNAIVARREARVKRCRVGGTSYGRLFLPVSRPSK